MTRQEAIDTLGVSVSTLKRYVKKGLIRTSTYEIPGRRGKNNYWDEDILALMGRTIHKGHEIVGYLRVNGSGNKHVSKLNEQRDRMRDYTNRRGISLDNVYEDYCPSTEFSMAVRPALHELIKRIMDGHVDALVIDTKDRLFRIGYDLLETIFNYHGCKIIVMNLTLEDEYYQKEQSDDIAKLLEQAKIDRLGPSE
jgi:predicted site-specific integrase-resolvase